MSRWPHWCARAACDLALICLALIATQAKADEAREVFDSVYAAKIKAAVASADRADDIVVAKDLLQVARTITDQSELVFLLCEGAHDLSSKHTDGLATAIQAMQFLADTDAGKRPAAHEKLVLLFTRQSTIGKPEERDEAVETLIDLLTTMGDERAAKKQYADAVTDYRRAVSAATQHKSTFLEALKSKLELATTKDRAIKSIDRLQEKLLKDANDFATAEEIVRLHVIDLDDPSSALPLLDRVKNAKLKEFVPLMPLPVTELNEEQCLILAEFHRDGAVSLKGPSKTTQLTRARQYLERFVAIHTSADIQLTKAKVLLKDVVAELDDMATAPGTCIDVFAKVDVDRHVAAGRFTSDRGRLTTVARMEWQALKLPYIAKGDYELRIRFTKTPGGSFELYLARDDRQGIFVLLGDGITSKEWGKARKPVTIVPNAYRAPADGKPHMVRAIVKAKRIVVMLDNVKVIDHPIDFAAVPPEPTARTIIAASDITLTIDEIVIIE